METDLLDCLRKNISPNALIKFVLQNLHSSRFTLMRVDGKSENLSDD